MRILIHSNGPNAQTGYGIQTRMMMHGFQRLGHEVAVSAFWGQEGCPAVVPSLIEDRSAIPVYPKAMHAYGLDVWQQHYDHFKADVLLSLVDAWVLDPSTIRPDTRWAPYYPVDMDPFSIAVRRNVQAAWERVCMSLYGQQVCADAGVEAAYAPHAYDDGFYYPDLDARKEWREANGVADKYVVGIVAANKGQPARKSWPQQIEAFAEFHKHHPDSVLYVHTTLGARGEMGGVNLPEVFEHFQLPDGAVKWCDQYQWVLGHPDHHMRRVYNGLDVLLNVSMGEGFGVPIVEAQACGTPVIAGDWTSMPELVRTGWLVDKRDSLRWWTPLAAFQYIPQPAAITDQLREAYEAGEQPRSEVSAKVAEYEILPVLDAHWRPLLERWQKRIDDEGILPVATLNRAQRRAQKARKERVA